VKTGNGDGNGESDDELPAVLNYENSSNVQAVKRNLDAVIVLESSGETDNEDSERSKKLRHVDIDSDIGFVKTGNGDGNGESDDELPAVLNYENSSNVQAVKLKPVLKSLGGTDGYDISKGDRSNMLRPVIIHSDSDSDIIDIDSDD
jgi:hypothetical protein